MTNDTFLAKLRANAERYKEIQHLRDRVKSLGPSYAEARYSVTLDDETRKLSNDDLILLCDGGNACFGGFVEPFRSGPSVAVTVYTD